MDDFNKKAEEFLKETGTTFKAEFVRRCLGCERLMRVFNITEKELK